MLRGLSSSIHKLLVIRFYLFRIRERGILSVRFNKTSIRQTKKRTAVKFMYPQLVFT